MADIDFDELDKAVNNLMGGVKDDDKTPEPRTVELDSTLDTDEKLSFDKLNVAVKSIGSEDEKPSEPEENFEDDAPEEPKINLAARPKPNSGRFMDMVHPSADMRPSAAARPAMASHARPVVPSRVKDISELEDAESEPDMQTPFLPDANEKISKRPLGAVPSPVWDSSHDDDNSEEAKPIKIDAEKSPAELPIGGEVSDDLEAEEGADDQLPPDPTHVETEPTDQDRVLQSIESMEVAGIPAEDESEQESVSDQSIQLIESGDTENLRTDDKDDSKEHSGKREESVGGIYDVKEYHKPLSHAPKHKSGLGTVVVIIAVIVICIALAASAFFVFGGGL